MTDISTSTDNTSANTGTKIVEYDGVIENLYGKLLPVPLSFKGTFEEVQTYDAIPAKELPDKDDQLALVNNRRKANERAKSMAAVTEAASKAWAEANKNEDGTVKDGNPYEKPTLATSDDLKVKNMVDSMMASKKVKYTREQATAAARKLLGLDE